jgi:hypothetical protein
MASKRLMLGFLAAIAVVAATGCTRKSSADFTPSSGNARTALESALKSWQEGQSPGVVAGTAKPVVRVEDSEWTSGKKLSAYEIVGDEAPVGLGPRVFTVRITTADDQKRDVKYMVVGIDPLLIYRDVDYDKLSGMSK